MNKIFNSKKFTMNQKAFSKAISLAVFMLLLFAVPVVSFAQNITVRGKVTKSDGQPAQNISVIVKGTTTGTTTNDAGSYQITAPSNGTLVFSGVDLVEQEATINGRTTIDIVLIISETSMDAVVVVGYGTQRKIDVTGAVARVNLEAMGNAPNTNIGQFLQGTVPGLNVGLSTFAGGTPPIQIRGQVTLNGSQNVLIILDGVQYTGSLSSINPDDIASIDVLKDASSTAVYGAQAANGVILITSRKGRAGKTRVSYSGAYTTQKPTQDFRPFDREGFLNGIRDAYWMDAYLGPDYTQINPAFNVADYVDNSMKNNATGELLPNNYDWWNEATSPGSIWENNLSISGGTDKASYLLSGGFVDQKNFINADLFKRHTVRANLEIKAFDFWKVGIVSSGAFVNQDGAEPTMGIISITSPLLVPYDADGNLIPSPTNTVVPNPLLSYDVDDRERHQYYFANLYSDLDIPFIKGLNYRINFGQNFRTDQHYFASQYGAGLTGQAYKENQDYYDYTFDNILNYTKSFGKHDLTLTALYGAIERKYSRTYAEGTGFQRLNLSYNNIQSASIRNTTTNAWSEALNYQMGRVNYKYDDKYLLTATIRRDGYSGFAQNNKYATFPSVGLGWIISRENFMNNAAWVNFLKLRLTYGSIGNQTQRYMSLARVGTNAAYVYGDGSNTAFGQQVNSLANADLRWEVTNGINIGLDFTLINSRLTGSLEYYNNNTTDLLYSVNIPTITGFQNIMTNLGKIHNTGFEASLTYQFVNKRDFNWSSTFNFWSNKNRIKTLIGLDNDGDGKEDDLVASNLFIGQSIQTIFGYQAGPIYQIGDTPPAGFYTGTLSVIDQDKSGDITPDDRAILGRQEPAYRFSFYNTMSYKGFALSFFINSVQGGKDGFLANNLREYFRDDNAIRNNEFSATDFWSPRNPGGRYPRNISGNQATFRPGLYQARSFVRLQDISLSYNLPSSILGKIKAQAINVYISAKNLVTWTNWDGWDPEALVPVDGNQVPNGMLLNGRPAMRGFTFGIHITY